MGALDGRIALALLLEQDGEHLERRAETELVGALPAFHAGNSDAGLERNCKMEGTEDVLGEMGAGGGLTPY